MVATKRRIDAPKSAHFGPFLLENAPSAFCPGQLSASQQHLASGSFGVTSCVRGVSRVSHDKVFIHEGVTNDVFFLHDDDARRIPNHKSQKEEC